MATIGELIGTGRVAEVYLYGDNALKLYRAGQGKRSAFAEAAQLALVEQLGVPAPRVLAVGQYDGRWGLEMTRVEGPSFGDAVATDPGALPRYLDTLAALHRHMHEAVASGLPPLHDRIADRLASVGGIDDALRRDLQRRLLALPSGDRLLHGDFHPYNVMGSPDAPTIVDWVDAARGTPAADVGRSYLLLRTHSEELADAYLAAYLRGSTLTATDVLAWLPVLAAARLAENVAEETEALLALARSI